jgi:SPP1 family predicted phage head-tail adaptor
MRAGNLDRRIGIDRAAVVKDPHGVERSSWSRMANVRAQVVQSSTEEFMRAPGASTETAIVFRIRYLAGLTTADRIAFDGQFFNVVEIKEIGRRHGLEIRAVARAA